MARVTGIGGIFFKGADPAGLARWYEKHLGIALDGDSMSIMRWGEPDGYTVWSLFARDDAYFGSDVPFMVNYRVDDLDALLAALRADGVAVDERTDDSEFGKFGWLTDPEGNRIELWQPPR